MSDSVAPSPRARADCRADADALGTPRVEIVRHGARITRVSLIGEHDLSSKEAMLDAFASAAAQPCVVVDFSRCTFADSTVIGLLVALHGTSVCAIRLVVPATQRTVRRTFQMVQMEQFFPLHDSLGEALLAAGEEGDAANLASAREGAS